MTRTIVIPIVGLFATACYAEETDDSRYWDDVGKGGMPAEIIETAIDTGRKIDVTPGVGAGFFIEYEAGGGWHLFTSCDTELTNKACEWDVIAMIPRSKDLTVAAEDNLESSDVVLRLDEGAVRLIASTDTDFDGIVLQAPPGQRMRVDVLLDGFPALRFVNWVGGGALNRGIPSNPIDFAPTDP